MTDPLSEAVDAATPPTPPPYAVVLARRDRRRTRRRAVLAGAGAVVLVAGILGGAAALGPDDRRGAAPVADPTPTVTGEPTRDPRPSDREPPEWDGASPPPVYLLIEDRQVRIDPWSSCYSSPPDAQGNSTGMCVDGFPQPPFQDVGDRAEVGFLFPLAGWTFQATFTPQDGRRCGERSITVPALETGRRSFVVGPGGPPGDYQVDLFGSGPEGSVSASFTWSTHGTGYLPEPRGYVGLVTDSGNGTEAYPLEMGITDLATTPDRATVTVTATDADGDTRTIGPLEAEGGCSAAGHVFFREGDGGAAGPTDLGPGPVTYRAELVLDGTTYVGTAVWPRDERADEAPYADLEFDPPLPAYEGE